MQFLTGSNWRGVGKHANRRQNARLKKDAEVPQSFFTRNQKEGK